MIAVKILIAWLLADFASGIFHWWEDRYGVEDWPIIGPLIVAPNIDHHSQPTAFLRQGFFMRDWTTFAPAWILAAAAFHFGSPWLAMTLFFAGFGNTIHAWAHQKCSRPIRGLQLLGVLQSQEQHARHHRKPFDCNYCVMTDWLNPILTATRFWIRIEYIVWLCFGVAPRAARMEA